MNNNKTPLGCGKIYRGPPQTGLGTRELYLSKVSERHFRENVILRLHLFLAFCEPRNYINVIK